MWGIPLGLIIKVGVGLAIAAALAWFVHSWKESLREEGRAEVRAEWNAEKDKMAHDLMKRSENAEREKQEAERKAVLAERARVAKFAALKDRAAADAADNPVPMSPAYVGVLRDARSAAEASRPPGTAEEAAPAPSESAQAYGVAMLEWAAIAIERDGLWREFVDVLRRACTPTEGAAP